uniref:Uncharacterized protein n=1 Tax=Utricularia reniformis TaxID=192314 RepID=A0A1Y0AZD1_9LAMI|nr:hypothetical protein AEK19_MT0223 [Utricularia reniformis]ART30500.1 hypothetical protein AEK19_MT0223 [Utricularia reniformis]
MTPRLKQQDRMLNIWLCFTARLHSQGRSGGSFLPLSKERCSA